jgi:hypothetical protein
VERDPGRGRVLPSRRSAGAGPMIDRDHPEGAELTEQDLAVATLVGRYIERRETGQPPCADDLIAVAAEFGDAAVHALCTLLACYEAMRATEDLAP